MKKNIQEKEKKCRKKDKHIKKNMLKKRKNEIK